MLDYEELFFKLLDDINNMHENYCMKNVLSDYIDPEINVTNVVEDLENILKKYTLNYILGDDDD